MNFIPITDEDQFCGLVGNNGIGKSSVLESLDCFFNRKIWNYHTSTKNKLAQSQPDIVPVFLLLKSTLHKDTYELAEILSDFCKNFTEIDAPPTYLPLIKNFITLRNQLARNLNLDDYFLLPLGIDYNFDISVSVFKSKELSKIIETIPNSKEMPEKELNVFIPLLNEIRTSIEYIYIPREIDPELFTKLETSEIQILMGETLTEIISKQVPPNIINDINQKLTTFIDDLSTKFTDYAYRTSNESRQQKIKKNDVYSLIIKAFFGIRKLHKQQGDNWLEISLLSSGEKQKAIIDVAHTLLTEYRKSGANLIIGIDEPESSLHMSACFGQFDALYEMSRNCRQVIFSSHWYGFLPTIESGSATIIFHDDKNQHVFDLINLANYREQIKQMRAVPKLHLPHDIRLKSMNDFVQSVITSTIDDDPYNWIICEGSSEKIYLNKYFEDIIKSKKLRIVPVGGAIEIKRLYTHLSTSYEDFKDAIKGKIILVSDTDTQLLKYDVSAYENLHCKRIVNCAKTKTTILVDIQSNLASPKTEIEDALNGKLFLSTLKTFKDTNLDTLDFINEIETELQNSPPYALDLRTSETAKIEVFFDSGNNKFLFAKKYAENIGTEYNVPLWILEIRKLLN